MDPIIRIVNYIFKKNNLTNYQDTIESFFDSGTAFPQFISIIFNENIPYISQNPSNPLQVENNNVAALKFLIQRNSDIADLSPSFITKHDKRNLLVSILTNQCFKTDSHTILNKYNLILQPLGIKYEKVEDLINKQCILSLLNVLTDGKIQIESGKVEFEEDMSTAFEIAKVPLFIDKNSLNIHNKCIFLIQIEVIFEIFSDRINQIFKSVPNLTNSETLSMNNQKSSTNKLNIRKMTNLSIWSNNSDSPQDLNIGDNYQDDSKISLDNVIQEIDSHTIQVSHNNYLVV